MKKIWEKPQISSLDVKDTLAPTARFELINEENLLRGPGASTIGVWVCNCCHKKSSEYGLTYQTEKEALDDFAIVHAQQNGTFYCKKWNWETDSCTIS